MKIFRVQPDSFLLDIIIEEVFVCFAFIIF